MTRLGREGSEASDPVASEAERVVGEVTDARRPSVLSVLKRGKSDVYLVDRVGDPPVVAKLAASDTIANEFRILTLLAAAPFRCLRVHGTAASSVAQRSWLVSEYASGTGFQRRDEGHRRLAAGWLARVHTWSDAHGPLALADRGVDYHHEVTQQARATLIEALTVLPAGHFGREPSAALVEMTDLILTAWDEVADDLRRLPAVLVHSGFAGKNIVISEQDGAAAVLAFDWEQGGWGSGVADLSMVDVDTYALTVKESWPDISRDEIRRASMLGQALWCLAPIPGERSNLVGHWPDRALNKLGVYLTWGQEALSELGMIPARVGP